MLFDDDDNDSAILVFYYFDKLLGHASKLIL